MPPGDDEIKDGQWLGVTVRSMGPGKKVMVCGLPSVGLLVLGAQLLHVPSKSLSLSNNNKFVSHHNNLFKKNYNHRISQLFYTFSLVNCSYKDN